MVTTKLYVEGAGPRRAQQSQCRRAFARFFEAAGVQNRPGVEPCGGRKDAFDNLAYGDYAAVGRLHSIAS